MKKIKISPAVLLLTSQLFSQENSECYQEWKRMNASKDALYEFHK